jgi:hypothetical protein
VGRAVGDCLQVPALRQYRGPCDCIRVSVLWKLARVWSCLDTISCTGLSACDQQAAQSQAAYIPPSIPEPRPSRPRPPRRLKPDPARDDVNALLRSASTFAKRDVIAYLLTLNANPNDKENGGSSALDGCLKYLHWEDSYHFFDRKTVPASSLTKSRATIRLLIERGAQWRPDARTIADVRKVLYHIDPEVITEIVERLRFHHACDEVVLHELLRTPKMQDLLRAYRRSSLDTRVPRPRVRRSQASQPPEPPRLTASTAHYLSRYNRDRLYEEVWTAPTQQIAQQYGVTDVALAKACKHLKIPKPPRGYWAKKAAGLRVPPKPALPALPALRAKD